MSTTAEHPVEAPEAEAEESETPVETSPATEKTAAKLGEYAAYIHVGDGAAECAEPWKCDDEGHFHGWLRLPNQFQHEECRDHGLAAKARRIRQCKDPDTDIHAILEMDMDEILASGDKESVVEDLLGEDFLREHIEATKEIGQQEEYLTIDKDLERFRVLEEMEDEDRPADEWTELQKHITAYHDAIDAERDKEVEPIRESLMDKDFADLVDMVRENRIKVEGNKAFISEYKKWCWLVGTLEVRPPGKTPVSRLFGDINVLMSQDQEVLDAINETYDRLDQKYQESAGNS